MKYTVLFPKEQLMAQGSDGTRASQIFVSNVSFY